MFEIKKTPTPKCLQERGRFVQGCFCGCSGGIPALADTWNPDFQTLSCVCCCCLAGSQSQEAGKCWLWEQAGAAAVRGWLWIWTEGAEAPGILLFLWTGLCGAKPGTSYLPWALQTTRSFLKLYLGLPAIYLSPLYHHLSSVFPAMSNASFQHQIQINWVTFFLTHISKAPCIFSKPKPSSARKKSLVHTLQSDVLQSWLIQRAQCKLICILKQYN